MVLDSSASFRWFARLTLACVTHSPRLALGWQRDVNLEAYDIDGCTALIWAARETKDARVIEQLLKAGANPNDKAKNGWTPLHWAATFNKGEIGAAIAKMLLAHGADPTITASGMTPLEWARRNGNPEVAGVLDPATAAATAAAKELADAVAGPVSGLNAARLHRAVDAAAKTGATEVALKAARERLQLVEKMDLPLLRMLEALALTELAPNLLAHDILHVDTLAHIDIQLLMSTIGISLGKAARIHRRATQLAHPSAPFASSAQRQRVEL